MFPNAPAALLFQFHGVLLGAEVAAERACVLCVAGCSDNPGILDYIKLKHEVVELQKQLSDWRRKVDIASMERTRTRTLLRSVTQGSTTRGASTTGLSMEQSSGSPLGRAPSMRG